MDKISTRIIISSIAIFLIILIRYYQKSKTSFYSMRDDIIKPDPENNKQVLKSNIDYDYSIIKTIKNLIEDKNFILLTESINDSHFVIEFKNYDSAPFEFKRQSTYIKINGNLDNNTLDFSTWSDRYELGQNGHNESILSSFKRELGLTDQNNGLNPIKAIKDEIGSGAFQRWDQLTRKMLFESKKTRDQVLEELISYGLKKEMAEKILDLHKGNV